MLCYWYIDTYFDTVKTKDQNWGKYAFYGVLFILCQDISRDPVHFDKFVDSIVNSRVKITHNDQGFTKRFFDEKKYNVINENSVGETCTGLVHFM